MSQGGNTFGSDSSSVPDGGPPKRGMSTGVKVLLIVCGAFGLLAVLCCGGFAWWMSRIVSTSPEAVAAIQDKIVSIDVPERLQPAFGMDMGWPVKMQMAVRASSETEALTLMSMAIDGAANDPATKQQMQAQMQAQQAQQKQPGVRIDATEMRTVNIDGEQVSFEFSKGTHEKSGQPMRQVRGVFSGRDGAVVMFQYIVAESAWNEEEVMKMLRSISK
jgi:hypothetical protein